MQKNMNESSVFTCGPSCANEYGHYVYNNILRLANFMREDDDNVVFRRFESLQLTRLLVLQHRLSDCEASIEAFLEDGDVLELDEKILELNVLLRDYGKTSQPEFGPFGLQCPNPDAERNFLHR